MRPENAGVMSEYKQSGWSRLRVSWKTRPMMISAALLLTLMALTAYVSNNRMWLGLPMCDITIVIQTNHALAIIKFAGGLRQYSHIT